MNLGGEITTDELNSFVAEGLVETDIALTGVLDNIPADNPISDGSLVLGPTTGNLTLDGGTIDQGTVTTSGANRPGGHRHRWNAVRRDAGRHA